MLDFIIMENNKDIKIQSLDFEQFKDKYGTEIPNKEKHLNVLANDIEQLANFAIAPYFGLFPAKK